MRVMTADEHTLNQITTKKQEITQNFAGIPELLAIHRHRWKDNIKMKSPIFRDIGCLCLLPSSR